MSKSGERYLRIRAVLCADCPVRLTCPQFVEQMDACADALLIETEEEAPLPYLSHYLAEVGEEE